MFTRWIELQRAPAAGARRKLRRKSELIVHHRGIGKTTFCVTRSPRDGIGGMSGAFPATASGSDRVGASPCRDVLFVNVAVEEPKEERGSNREIATLAASRLGFSMTSLSPRLATTTSLSPRAPARLIWLGLVSATVLQRAQAHSAATDTRRGAAQCPLLQCIWWQPSMIVSG